MDRITVGLVTPAVDYNIANTPLYFVRSGNVEMNSGRLWVAGIGGYDWSLIAASKRNDGTAILGAYYLGFNVTGASPSGGPLYRWVGYPF